MTAIDTAAEIARTIVADVLDTLTDHACAALRDFEDDMIMTRVPAAEREERLVVYASDLARWRLDSISTIARVVRGGCPTSHGRH